MGWGDASMALGWFKKKPPAVDRAAVDRNALANSVSKIVTDYGAFVAGHSDLTVIRDQAGLPHDKEKLLVAFCYVLATQTLTTEMRQALTGCALSLAYYQPDVGKRDLHQTGVDLSKYDVAALSASDVKELLLGNPIDRGKYETFLPAVVADLERIRGRIGDAAALREKSGPAPPAS
jgi:hypothetical protein